MDQARENYRKLQDFILGELRLSLFGVADISSLRGYLHGEIQESAARLSRVIVAGYRLSGAVLDTIHDHPTQIYKTHYQQVNYLLDKCALEIATRIGDCGGKALPIPASHYVDPRTRTAHFSHRHAAVEAGLGWLGRNNLLVTPQYGAQVRLVSILTDLPLPAGKPLEFGCGNCFDCIKACPAGALSSERPYYDHDKCFAKLDEFIRLHRIGHHICGICVKACGGPKSK